MFTTPYLNSMTRERNNWFILAVSVKSFYTDRAYPLNSIQIPIQVFTFPLESAHRTINCLGFLLILENPFEKASLFFNGSEFKEVGFNWEVKEAWNGPNWALFRFREIGTEWWSMRLENDVVEAIVGEWKLRSIMRRWESEQWKFKESLKPWWRTHVVGFVMFGEEHTTTLN